MVDHSARKGFKRYRQWGWRWQQHLKIWTQFRCGGAFLRIKHVSQRKAIPQQDRLISSASIKPKFFFNFLPTCFYFRSRQDSLPPIISSTSSPKSKSLAIVVREFKSCSYVELLDLLPTRGSQSGYITWGINRQVLLKRASFQGGWSTLGLPKQY